MWWRSGLVGRRWAVVRCVGSVVSPVEGAVPGLSVPGLGLAVRGGHGSVLVYIHPQFIPKSPGAVKSIRLSPGRSKGQSPVLKQKLRGQCRPGVFH